MNFVAGVPISSDVRERIEEKQEIFGARDGSAREAYIKYQSLVPWVRFSSLVKVRPGTSTALRYGAGYTLAKNNVLFTEFKNSQEGLPGYEQTQLGYRPKPGIIDVQVHSHNRFGSLRTAVVKYQCWSKEQLDRLELLYMRPGFSVLLEWGHSGYLEKIGNRYEVSNDIFPIDFTKYTTREAITKEILAKQVKYSYHYDGICGVVKNFSWSLRPDGGYDCSTAIVTAGDITESLKINFYVSQKNIDDRTQESNDNINAAANAATTKQVNVKGVDKPVALTNLKEKEKLTLNYPAVSEIQLASDIKPANFQGLADPEEAGVAKAQYEEFKARVAATIAGSDQSSIAKSKGGGLYINPLDKTFGFSGNMAYGDGSTGVDLNRRVAQAATLVKAKSDLEILQKPKDAFGLVVLRFKD